MTFDPLYLFNNEDHSAFYKRRRTLTLEKDTKFLISEYCIKFIQWVRIECTGSKNWADQQLKSLLTACSELSGKAYTLKDIQALGAVLKPLVDPNLFKNLQLELRIRLLRNLLEFSSNVGDNYVLQWTTQFAVIDELVDTEKLAKHQDLKDQLEREKLKLAQEYRFLYALYTVQGASEEAVSQILRLSPLPTPEDRVQEQLALFSKVWKRDLSSTQMRELSNSFTRFRTGSWMSRLAHFFAILRYLQSNYEHIDPSTFPGGILHEAGPLIAPEQVPDTQLDDTQLDEHNLEEKMSEVPHTAGALEKDDQHSGVLQNTHFSSVETGQTSANTSVPVPSNFMSVQPAQTSAITPVPPLDTTIHPRDLTTNRSSVLFESQSSPVNFPLPMAGVAFNPDLDISGLSLFDKRPELPADVSDFLKFGGGFCLGTENTMQSQLSIPSDAQPSNSASHSKAFSTIPNAQPYSNTVEAQTTTKAASSASANKVVTQDKRQSQAENSSEQNQESQSQSFNIPLAQEMPWPQLPPSASETEDTLSQEVWPSSVKTLLGETQALQPDLNSKKGEGNSEAVRSTKRNENGCETPWTKSTTVDREAQVNSVAESQFETKSTLDILNNLCESACDEESQWKSNSQSQRNQELGQKNTAFARIRNANNESGLEKGYVRTSVKFSKGFKKAKTSGNSGQKFYEQRESPPDIPQ